MPTLARWLVLIVFVVIMVTMVRMVIKLATSLLGSLTEGHCKKDLRTSRNSKTCVKTEINFVAKTEDNRVVQ